MSGAKIRLSEKEKELVLNADIILTKNDIIGKAKLLLAQLQHEEEEIISQHSKVFPPETLLPRPKISRGENYRGLPYLILDYPRCFEKEDILAIRTMFWWGNYFSVTLHLSGNYKKIFQEKIIAVYETIAGNDLYINIHHNQWEHHFEKDNYSPVNEMTAAQFGTIIRKAEFIKLAQKIPLTQWDDAKNILLSAYKNLVSLIVS